VADLETALDQGRREGAKRAVVVTDGIFSMRGDHAPLVEIQAMVRKFDARFPENAVLVVDDSHGVGAFGATGRGTEEFTGCEPVDILVGTLGKAFGVNGGYVTGSRILVDFLRETSMMYIYSNPITPAEAAAAKEAVESSTRPRASSYLAHLQAR
jgi:glycine C-acetyltransferase